MNHDTVLRACEKAIIDCENPSSSVGFIGKRTHQYLKFHKWLILYDCKQEREISNLKFWRDFYSKIHDWLNATTLICYPEYYTKY